MGYICMDQRARVQVVVIIVKKTFPLGEKKHSLSGSILVSFYFSITWGFEWLYGWNIKMNIDLKVFLYLEALILI